MKKGLAAIILIMVIFGNLYAHDDHEFAKNRIALSLGLLGADLSYERMIVQNFSVLGQVSYTTWAIADSLAFDGKARWYPFYGAFYLEMGLGYSNGYNATEVLAEFVADLILGVITLGLWFASDNFQNRWSEVHIERQHGLSIQPGMGWNVDIGKKGGFMLPISLGLNIRLSENTTVLPYIKFGIAFAF